MQELTDMDIGRYHLTNRLARGGMAEIYLADDPETAQTVALKLVPKASAEYSERFRREIREMSSCHHPHVLPILDYGEDGAWNYSVMPYMRYGTLNNIIGLGPLSFEETGLILDQLASALQYVHKRGIVHRDIKPSNVLIQDDQHIYLADFGLVKRMDEYTEPQGESLTLSGYLIGTPEYMAPELAEIEATIYSDIYALGVLVYQMLTGRVPFKGSNPMSTYLKQINELPVAPSVYNAAIPQELDQVILKVLSKHPLDRFHKATDFSAAYQQVMQDFKCGKTMVAKRGDLVSRDIESSSAIEELETRPHQLSVLSTFQVTSNRKKMTINAKQMQTLALLASTFILAIAVTGFSLFSVGSIAWQASLQPTHTNSVDLPLFKSNQLPSPTAVPTLTPRQISVSPTPMNISTTFGANAEIDHENGSINARNGQGNGNINVGKGQGNKKNK